MMSTIKSLPNEILQQVLEYLNSTDTRECILVCKNWKQICQEYLYTTVKLYSVLQLSRFLNTLKKYNHVQASVREITLSFNSDNVKEDAAIKKLLTNLPNLRYIDLSYGIHYKILLEALLIKQLPHLNSIEPPKYFGEVQDYTTCLILRKDCLKRLSVREYTTVSYITGHGLLVRDTVPFDRIFDILEQFVKVEDIQIQRKFHNKTASIEKVTHDCPLIKRLSINFMAPDDIYVTQSNIPNTIDSSNVMHLKLSGILTNDWQLKNYIVDKFPQLKTLQLSEEGKHTCYLDEVLLNKFLKYLSKIQQIKGVKIPFEERSLITSIGPFWKTISQYHTLSIEFQYARLSFGPDGATEMMGLMNVDMIGLNMTKPDAIMEIEMKDRLSKNTFFCSSSDNGSKHLNVLQEHGRYIDELQFHNVVSKSKEEEDFTLYEILVIHPLKSCVYLKSLSIVKSTLTGFNLSKREFFEKRILNRLHIENCTVEKVVFFQGLAQLFDSIGHLQLHLLKDINSGYGNGIVFENINMEDTNIGTLSLEKGSSLVSGRGEEVILLKISTQERVQYFIYDCELVEDLVFQPVKKDFYEMEQNLKGRYTINIRCKSIGKIEVKHKWKLITLTVV